MSTITMSKSLDTLIQQFLEAAENYDGDTIWQTLGELRDAGHEAEADHLESTLHQDCEGYGEVWVPDSADHEGNHIPGRLEPCHCRTKYGIKRFM